MPEQEHDYVDFMAMDSETDTMKKVCRVYLTKGKLHYEGAEAEQVKKEVDDNHHLKHQRKIGGYTLLAALPHVFNGSYFHATKVKEPFDDVKEDEEGDDENQ